MLRRPERNSALSLTRATRIAEDDGADDETVFADGDAVDFAMDRAVSLSSPHRRLGRFTDARVVVKCQACYARDIQDVVGPPALTWWRAREETTRAARGITQQVQAMSHSGSHCGKGRRRDRKSHGPRSSVASSRTPEVVAAAARGRMVMTFV